MTEPTRILIVDDDLDFADAVRAVLEAEHFAVDVTHNPKDGFAALKARRYDLVLLDVMMGRGAEGVMLARKIRKDPALRGLPLLVVTGIRDQIRYMVPGHAVQPDVLPLDGLVEKPVEPAVLLAKVRGLLGAAAATTPEPSGRTH